MHFLVRLRPTSLLLPTLSYHRAVAQCRWRQSPPSAMLVLFSGMTGARVRKVDINLVRLALPFHGAEVVISEYWIEYGCCRGRIKMSLNVHRSGVLNDLRQINQVRSVGSCLRLFLSPIFVYATHLGCILKWKQSSADIAASLPATFGSQTH